MAGSRKDAKYRKARKTHKTKAQTLQVCQSHC